MAKRLSPDAARNEPKVGIRREDAERENDGAEHTYRFSAL